MNGRQTMRRIAVGGIAVTGAAVFMLLAFRYREAGRGVAGRAKDRLATVVRRRVSEPHDGDSPEG